MNFDKIVATSPQNVLLCRDKPSFEVQAANGESCPVMFKTIIAFDIDKYQYQEEFIVLKEMNTLLLGLPFFKYNGIDILTTTGMPQLPEMTVQLNSMLKPLQNPDPLNQKAATRTLTSLLKLK